MNDNNHYLQKYKQLGKIYNQIWIISILFAFGLIIMQIASGNIRNENISTQIPEFECEITPDNQLTKAENIDPKTNTNIVIVELNELIQTNLKVNEVPPIINPKFTNDHQLITKCLPDDENLVVIEGTDSVKAYPITILQQHLIVNDFVDEKPILISTCSLCNSPRIYERTINDTVLSFGTTGILYRNNDLFFDDKSNSLWSQINGKAIVGDTAGQTLREYEFKLIPLKKIDQIYSDYEILTFDTGYRRNYADSSFKDFESSDSIIAPVKNQSNKYNPKTLIYSINIGDKDYYLNVENINFSNNNSTIDGKILSVSNIDGIFEITYDNTPVQYKQTYWYVWNDHYPDSYEISFEDPVQPS